jgi:uncharacterized protein
MFRLHDLSPTDPLLGHVAHHNRAAVPAVNDLDPDGLASLVGEALLARALLDVTAPPDDPGHLAGFVLVLGPGLAYPSPNYAYFERTEQGRYAYVDRVVVAAGQRGRGLGHALYDQVEQAARAAGAAAVCAEVNVRPRNDPSLAFHAARGFVPVGEQDTSDTTRVRLLRRTLAPAA